MSRVFFLFLPLVLLTGSLAQAQDSEAVNNWPHWRGPLNTGASPTATPPITWSETENVKWKINVPGRGSATPIVWNDEVFVLTAIPTDRVPDSTEEAAEEAEQQPERGGGRRGRGGFGQNESPKNIHEFVVICYDRETGEEKWRKVANEAVPHESGHSTNTFASGSPTTDGKHLYASFGSFGVFCYTLDGDLVWKRDLGQMRTRNGFGEGTSPTLHKDKLIVTWDHEGESSIHVLDAATGETLWSQERDEPTTWATPLVVEHDGQTQVITNGTNRVRSYDLATGNLIWECGGQAANPIPSPVLLDDLVYVMTGYRGYAVYAIPLSARGDITGSDTIAWSRTDTGPYVSSPVLYNGTLYLTKGRDNILYSIDARTGEKKIEQQRIPGLGTLYASPVAADGHVFITDRDGTTVVIEDAPQMEVVSTNKLDEGVDASLVLVDDQIFIRGSNSLYCIER